MSMSALNVFSAVARLSKGFWLGPHATRAWMLTIGAFALALLDVAVQVALNHWTKDFYDAIEGRSVDRLTRAAFFFSLF
jgi:putative ATP-binding cassette transporter